MSLYSEHSDEALVALLQQNDHNAFREIYDRYWQRLFAQALRQLDDAYEAEDKVQQIFVEIWERRANIRINRSLQHWLAAAVKYKVLSAYAERYRRSQTRGELPADIPGGLPLPHTLLEFHELLAQLEAAVEALPERARMVYRLSRDGNLSNREIAEQLNISEKTVENHMNRALTSLRKTFGDAAMSVLIILL